MTDDNVIDLEAPYGRKKDGTPKKKHSGGFARGGAAYAGEPGVVSKGDGWGGAARGKGSDAPVGPKPENMKPYRDMPPAERERVSAAKAYREMTEAEVAIEMRQKLLDLARNAAREETQLSAATALDNRVSGLPTAKNVNVDADSLRAWMLAVEDEEKAG